MSLSSLKQHIQDPTDRGFLHLLLVYGVTYYSVASVVVIVKPEVPRSSSTAVAESHAQLVTN